MSKSDTTNSNRIPEGNARNYAYVTVVTNMSYFLGLSILAKSFKRTKAKYPLFVLVPEKADPELKQKIHALKLSVIECDDISIDEDFRNTNRVSSWNQTFFKLNIMNLVQFDKIVFVDADMLLLQNIDHLFEYPSISATTGGKAANPAYVEFNSGLLVIEPSEEIFRELLGCIVPAIKRKTALKLGYGDQDVFNEYYSNWKNEPSHQFDEIYNAEITYLDVLMKTKGFRRLSDVAILHYIGKIKIWNYSLLDNIRIIHGCLHERKFFEARARMLYLWRLYCMR